jgi:hypothetical protein
MIRNNKVAVTLAVVMLFVSNSAYAATPDWVLPHTKDTPGVINKSVTQDNIKDNVCKSGWTATIRPTVAYTNKLKDDQLKTTYADYVKIWGPKASAYEEDHLISLQLGGDPKDPKNLFPQPYAGSNARKKDVVETKLKKLVCAGTLKLVDAQQMISTDWAAAYKKYASKDTAVDDLDN